MFSKVDSADFELDHSLRVAGGRKTIVTNMNSAPVVVGLRRRHNQTSPSPRDELSCSDLVSGHFEIVLPPPQVIYSGDPGRLDGVLVNTLTTNLREGIDN